jgi:diketogulonate reductase-like aldo/keto reductase
MEVLAPFTQIGLGTWNMEKDAKNAVHALRAGLDAGSNHIDTAEMYGDGRAETIVGEAISGRRDKIFLVSKVLPSNAGYESTLKACEQSLSRLKTDYMDVYLLHWRGRTPLAETFRAFEKLKSDGKIRAWGVSNFDVKDLEEAVKIGKPVCNQVYYSIEERTVEARILPWCRAQGIRVVAYSPLGQGRLPEHKELEAIAAEVNATPAQVALSFLIHDKNVIAIPKSSDAERARENVGAMKISLTDQHLERLNAAFPLKARRGLPTL